MNFSCCESLNSWASLRRVFAASRAVDFVLILAVASFFCLYNLDQGSLSANDETQHVLVTQNMMKTGDYLNLSTGENIYLGKPPLKMWISTIPVWLLGQSNFSFRLTDALFAIGTSLLLYLLAIRMFSSRIAGLVSVLALLGCHIFVLEHVARRAVQDSMLVFLFTLAMYVAWIILPRVSEVHRSYALPGENLQTGLYQRALLLGLIVGCAIFCKSTAAFVIYVVLGIYVLLCGDALGILRKGFAAALLTLLVSFLVPAPFFINRCMVDNEVCQGFLATSSIERLAQADKPYRDPWSYIRAIFVERIAVPPELLVLAVVFAAWVYWTRRDRRCLYLVNWALAPVLIFTVSKSYYRWYIAPALPGMSLLVGAAFAACLQALLAKESPGWRSWRPAAAVLFSILVSLSLGANLFVVGSEVASEHREIGINKLVRNMKAVLEKEPNTEVLWYEARRPALREMPYLNMLGPALTTVTPQEDINKSITKSEVAFVFSTPKELPKLAEARPFSAYALLEPVVTRLRSNLVLSYRNAPEGEGFTGITQHIDCCTGGAPLLYGFSDINRIQGNPVRWLVGESAAFLVTGAVPHRTLGANVSLRLASPEGKEGEHVVAEISLNGVLAGTFQLPRSSWNEYTVHVPSALWRDGRNVVMIRFRRVNGLAISFSERIALISSARVSISQ
jgi:4-amino-4-deoxy-L-arabinose transferase-like glycosyltransferase